MFRSYPQKLYNSQPKHWSKTPEFDRNFIIQEHSETQHQAPSDVQAGNWRSVWLLIILLVSMFSTDLGLWFAVESEIIFIEILLFTFPFWSWPIQQALCFHGNWNYESDCLDSFRSEPDALFLPTSIYYSSKACLETWSRFHCHYFFTTPGGND